MKYTTPFRDCREELNLTQAAAEILDDVRFLTTSITASMIDPENVENIPRVKIQTTAACECS